ncbi:MAG: hypothetical protein U0Q18_31860 [Bryobacteraceae bacterium]
MMDRLAPDSGYLTLVPISSVRRSTWIVLITGWGLFVALAAAALWQRTNDLNWIEWYFQWPSILFLVGLAGVEAWFCLSLRHCFLPGEPLYKAWTFIGLSAICDFTGSIFSQWLSSRSPLNPLHHLASWSEKQGQEIRSFGLVIGGTLRYALLAAGLYYVLRIYRKTGFLGRLKLTDWILVGLVVAYIIDESKQLIYYLDHGKSPSLPEILGWPVDPLLFVLLIETRLLARSIEGMGKGSVSQSWKAFTIAILLIWVGDLGIWATNYGLIDWPWTALGWFVWLPAAGAFAAAPALQLEAIEHAMDERGQDR